MKKSHRYKLTFILVWFVGMALVAFGGCHENISDESNAEKVYVPQPPDYASDEMWVTYPSRQLPAQADVFYIPSTWEYDWYTSDGRVSHYADPSRADHRADMNIEIDGVAEYMADGCNFYSPFYRHITLDSWATLNEDTINRRFHDVAFEDVKNAFSRFLSDFNHGRPFILAGFSQGGKSVVELLKWMDDETRSRLVAAYVMGYKVTPDDTIACPALRAARSADDTGVVVCYNSVSDVKYVKPVVAAPNVMVINPVNWRTDNLPAILDDTITVTLDPSAGVLVVEGYDGSSLPNILDILNVGDYHGAEPWLYSESLRKNFLDRVKAFTRSGVTPR